VSFTTPTSADIDAAARTIWGEARGEPLLGRQAVAAVIRNRAIAATAYKAKHGGPHPTFGDGTLASVCKAHFHATYQFTCWSPDDPNHAEMLTVDASNLAFVGCLPVSEALAAGTLDDPTKGATNYLNVPLTLQRYGHLPSWVAALTKTAVIGSHTFYK